MVDVLSDSFEQPLSKTKTPSSAVAISEPASAAVFCFLVGCFSFGCELGPFGDGVWVFVSGFLSGLPDNPSCVKCVMLVSCAGFPQSGTIGARGRPLRNGLILKGLDEVRFARSVFCKRRCGGWDTAFLAKRSLTWLAVPHAAHLGAEELSRNSFQGKGSPRRIHPPLESDHARLLPGRGRHDRAFSIPVRLDSPCFGRRLRIVVPCVSSESSLLFAQDAFDLEFARPHAVGLVPVYFSFAHRTIGEADRGDPFELSPASFAIHLS